MTTPRDSAIDPPDTVLPTRPVDPPSGSFTLAVLFEVLVALGRGEAPREIFRLITEKACLFTGCATAALVLLEPDREHVSFAAVAGSEAAELAGTRIHASDTVAGTTARTGEPYLAFRPHLSAAAPESLIESAAVIPLFDEGRPAGALAALNKSGSLPFDGSDLMALQTLAAAAAVALSSGRLRKDSQQRQRELASLYEAVRQVSEHLSGEEVLRTVVEQVAAYVETSAVVVFLLNDERSHFYIAEEEGLAPEDREFVLAAEGSLGGLALKLTEPILLSFSDEANIPGLFPPLRPLTLPPLFASVARSGIAAPIRSGETLYGLVLALSGQPFGVYGDAEVNLLSALSSQAAVAIENAFLYEEATRRAEEASTLYDLSQAVTSTLSLTEVLNRIADAVLSLIAVDKFALFLQEQSGTRLRLVVSRGLTPGAEERLAPDIGQGIPGWVLEFETPTAVREVAADHRNASLPLHPEGVLSMAAMPLQMGKSTNGVLCALSSRRRLFTVAEMELLYTITNQAATAIENARMYASVRHKSLELRRYFHRVARALGSVRDPEEVPELIAHLTMEVMGAERCTLHSVERDTEGGLALSTAASVGLRPAAGGAAGSESPTLWVARRARSLAVTDIAEDKRFAERVSERATRPRLASYLGVPLKNGGTVVGVLEVFTRAPRVWRGDEIRLLLTFASQAAVAFRNARLTRDQNRAERALRLTHQLLSLTDDPEKSLRAAKIAELLTQEMQISMALLTRITIDVPWTIDRVFGTSPPVEWKVNEPIIVPDEAEILLTSDQRTALLLPTEALRFWGTSPALVTVLKAASLLLQ